MKKKTQDEINRAVEEYVSSNKSLVEVAKNYGVTGGGLRKWVIKSGNKLRNNSQWKRNIQNEKEAIYLYQNGCSSTEIAKKFNVTRRTIQDWLGTYNVRARTVHDKFGITKETISRARELYSESKLNCCEIAKILGFSNRTILKWVSDIRRNQSQIAAIRIIKNGEGWNGKLKRQIIETKFGKLYYDSSYELDRINQHLNDKNLLRLERCADFINYSVNGNSKNYVPDFKIVLRDGSIIVEEIKPFSMINKLNNRDKFAAAKLFYKQKGIKFSVITEIKIYEKRAKNISKY